MEHLLYFANEKQGCLRYENFRRTFIYIFTYKNNTGRLPSAYILVLHSMICIRIQITMFVHCCPRVVTRWLAHFTQMARNQWDAEMEIKNRHRRGMIWEKLRFPFACTPSLYRLIEFYMTWIMTHAPTGYCYMFMVCVGLRLLKDSFWRICFWKNGYTSFVVRFAKIKVEKILASENM